MDTSSSISLLFLVLIVTGYSVGFWALSSISMKNIRLKKLIKFTGVIIGLITAFALYVNIIGNLTSLLIIKLVTLGVWIFAIGTILIKIGCTRAYEL